MDKFDLIDPDLALDLFEAPDGDIFAQRLLRLASDVSGIDEIFAYVTGSAQSPRMLLSASALDDAAERARAYTARFHRSDPLEALHLSSRPGTGFVRRIPTQDIARGEYRRLCFEAPRFAEKICFGWRKPEQSIVLSFYRREGRPEPNMAALGSLAQLAITGLSRLAKAPLGVSGLIEARLSRIWPSLTPRERDVCARTLAGETARDIASALGLGVGTVLTYRQRAYSKTGCSKANDLLASVMQ